MAINTSDNAFIAKFFLVLLLFFLLFLRLLLFLPSVAQHVDQNKLSFSLFAFGAVGSVP